MSTALEFSFNVHSTKFYGQSFEPAICKGVVVLVHGMGEHSGRYHSFVIPSLLKENLAIITYDQFGHGQTEGKRGHNPGYNSLLDCLDFVISEAEERLPKVPLFLYGHSMGGNLVINYSLRKKRSVKGVIATSPLLELAFEPPKWKMTAGKIIRRLAPSLTLPSELDATAISRDPVEVQKYMDDPLVHDKISANYSLAVFEAGNWAIEHASKLEIPTLVIHGSGDQITSHDASERFVNNSKKQAVFASIEGGFHELHNDLNKTQFITIICDWLQEQLR